MQARDSKKNTHTQRPLVSIRSAERFYEISYEEGSDPERWKISQSESSIHTVLKEWDSHGFYDTSDGGLLEAAASSAASPGLSPSGSYRTRSKAILASTDHGSKNGRASEPISADGSDGPMLLSREEQTEYIRSFLAINGLTNSINLRWCSKIELKAKVSSNVAATR